MNIPEHVAIIMDGNGRWAKSKKMPRLAGHKAGVEALRDVLETAGDIGIKHMTFYAFSTENWNRPEDEVSGLLNLLYIYLRSETKKLHKNNIKICTIGDISKLPQKAREELERTMELTKNNTSMTVHLALNYGGRDDILRAVKNITEDVLNHNITTDDINEDLMSKYLYTVDIPDPDLMIRTSGEFRISNFLLWQMAYTEMYFVDCYWPDFDGSELRKAVENYNIRDRRYGNVKV